MLPAQRPNLQNKLHLAAQEQMKRKPKPRLSNFARAPQHGGGPGGFRRQQSY